MKATLRLLIVAAVLVTAQMSFADGGSATPPCPNKAGGNLAVKPDAYAPTGTTAPAAPVVAPTQGTTV